MARRFDYNLETGLKKCSGCNKHKPERDFGKNSAAADGYKYRCVKCVTAAYRVWKKDNPEKVKAANTRQTARRKKAYEMLRNQEASELKAESLKAKATPDAPKSAKKSAKKIAKKSAKKSAA